MRQFAEEELEIFIINLLFVCFSQQVLLRGRALESEWQQVLLGIRIFLSILSDLNRHVLWIISIFIFISDSSCLFPDFWKPFKKYQMVKPSSSCSRASSALRENPSFCPPFCAFLNFYYVVRKNHKIFWHFCAAICKDSICLLWFLFSKSYPGHLTGNFLGLSIFFFLFWVFHTSIS